MPNLPRPALPVISARLAQNIDRVGGVLLQMERTLDQPDTSTAQADWFEVLQLCDFVATSSERAGYPQVAEQARQVGLMAAREETRSQAMEGLVRLIGMCGRIQLADDVTSASSVKPLT